MATTSIPSEIRERIVAAAEALFAEGNGERLPAVDAVRRLARVDMNAASVVMREWRQAQIAPAVPVAEQVPESVREAQAQAGVVVWRQALALANDSLRTAQAAWQAERGELEAMRGELAEAYELQAAETQQAQQEAAGLRVELARVQALAVQEAAGLRGQWATAQEQARTAEARVSEITRRADELRAELDRAHQDADQLRGVLSEQRQAHQAIAAQLDQVRAELARVQGKAEAAQAAHQEQRKTVAQEIQRAADRLTAVQAERDAARQAVAQAREEAARLAGQLAAHQQQSAALLARLAPGEAPGRTPPPGK